MLTQLLANILDKRRELHACRKRAPLVAAKDAEQGVQERVARLWVDSFFDQRTGDRVDQVEPPRFGVAA